MILTDFLLPRGVYRAPCLGPQGETIVYAVDHNHRIVKDGRRYVPIGENPITAAAELWEILEQEDPVPAQAHSRMAG